MAEKTTGMSREMIIHPGESLKELLQDRNISQASLATMTGVSPVFISNVIAGKRDISPSFAMALEYALGTPKTFWLNLQSNYDAELQDYYEAKTITQEERKVAQQLTKMVDAFKEQGRLLYGVPQERIILGLRRILGISNLANLRHIPSEGLFKIEPHKKINLTALGAWMRLCQIELQNINTENKFEKKRTSALLKDLKSIMVSSSARNMQSLIQEKLIDYGIAFTVVKNYGNEPVKGYVARRDNGSYQMAIALESPFEDAFWFALFHEIGHIYHGDMDARQKEYLDFGLDSAKERRADQFAREALLDPQAFQSFVSAETFTYKRIEEFADSQNVKPCIVISRLQKEEMIPHNRFASRKPKFTWSSYSK